MRDGTVLVGDVYLPRDAHGPLPTVVIRTPYGKQNLYYTDPAPYLASFGYAVLVQDVRGRGDSQGEFYPFFNNEGPDGYDTIEWAAEQPWSDGRVAMMGGSYSGWVQWCAAAERPPHLVTMVSASAATRWMQQVPFHNGVHALVHLPWLFGLRGHAMQSPLLIDNWDEIFLHLPLIDLPEFIGAEIPVWKEWLQRPRLDEWWKSRRLQPADFEAVTQPVLHITSTLDGTQPGALFAWEGALAHSPAAGEQHMIFGVWDHLGAASSFQRRSYGGVDFGEDAVLDVNDLHRRWFDHHLKGIQAGVDEPVARVFFSGISRWHDAASWPPPGETVTWYLHSAGSANSKDGDGVLNRTAPDEEPSDSFAYDPANPVYDVPDFSVYAHPDPLNPIDPKLVRDFVERRPDVLVYTSEPQERDLAIAGQPRILLFGGSDAPDTEWHVWLADVAPDGTSVTLVRGQLCARFSDALEEEHFMEPGVTYRFDFELLSLAHVFLAGHRIRLVIASSDFPTYCRSQNTAHPIGMSAEIRVARNAVSHSGLAASCLLLPVTAALSA
jgi:uncharacterized protein